jgi:hypothetical protein
MILYLYFVNLLVLNYYEWYVEINFGRKKKTLHSLKLLTLIQHLLSESLH